MKVNPKAFDAVAKALTEFGYRDVTAAMIRECHTAWIAGKKVPHGIIGMFAAKYFDDRPDLFGKPEAK